jgi:hypothetical protein
MTPDTGRRVDYTMVLADIGTGDAFSSRDRVARSSRLREANEAGSTPCSTLARKRDLAECE